MDRRRTGAPPPTTEEALRWRLDLLDGLIRGEKVDLWFHQRAMDGLESELSAASVSGSPQSEALAELAESVLSNALLVHRMLIHHRLSSAPDTGVWDALRTDTLSFFDGRIVESPPEDLEVLEVALTELVSMGLASRTAADILLEAANK